MKYKEAAHLINRMICNLRETALKKLLPTKLGNSKISDVV